MLSCAKPETLQKTSKTPVPTISMYRHKALIPSAQSLFPSLCPFTWHRQTPRCIASSAEELRAGSHLAEVPDKTPVWFLFPQGLTALHPTNHFRKENNFSWILFQRVFS